MLRHALIYFFAWGILVMSGNPAASAGPPVPKIVPLGQVIKEVPGTFRPQDGRCQARLDIAELGGFRILSIRTIGGRWRGDIEDVSGIAWASKDLLVFTVSPIYGKPGVFAFSCATGHIRRLVAPKTFNKGSPDGADYFELESLSLEAPGKIRYYYAPDVEKVDFYRFPSDDLLFEVNLDGSGFRKVAK